MVRTQRAFPTARRRYNGREGGGREGAVSGFERKGGRNNERHRGIEAVRQGTDQGRTLNILVKTQRAFSTACTQQKEKGMRWQGLSGKTGKGGKAKLRAGGRVGSDWERAHF